MPALANIAKLTAQPGKSDSLGSALNGLVAPTKAEDGCFAYEVHRSLQDGNVWMVYERWRSQADADAHLTQPHVQKFIAVLGDLVAGSIDVQSYAHA